ncbi:ribosomal protein S18-alanine N-acetyltransferase [Cryptosporangium phraense]|uniref:[Ribosomal protein bS18]-alanine N-acetyltransferase n=1 Tax=Cryptosporangium phraense TaxID=2593070 RepID=A0A545AZB4_9ACTN|nr:ribosomal-protein-alanine N-acetyltransferase [Cryptosporangium phraense]
MRWWHIEEIAPLERDLFGDEEWSAGMFWSELAQADTRWYRVALENDEVIGYAGLCVYGPEDAWVQNIAVRRDRQGAGLGRKMLDELLEEAVRRGARQVLLEVRADNAPAQRLYARRGFEAIGLRRGYYQPSNTDAVVMRWEMT